MTEVHVTRRTGGTLVPLVSGPHGLLCSEGDVVVLSTRTSNLPVVTMSGESLTPRTGTLAVSSDGFVAEFERLIDAWAGRTTLVVTDGSGESVVRLDVGPFGRKLGEGEWDALIAELAAVSASLPWGMSPGSASGAAAPDALATVHPALVEHDLPILLRLLRTLLADPPTRTVRTRAARPLDLCRAVDPLTLRWLSRRPVEAETLRGRLPDGAWADRRPVAEQGVSTVSLDHPVTRYVAHLLARVRVRLGESARLLRSPARHGVPDPVANGHARRLADLADAAAAALAAAGRAPALRAVRPEPISDAVLQSLPDHPVQSAVHRVCRRLLQPGLAYAPGQGLLSGLKHSYDLFELLALYRLVAMVSDALGPGWTMVLSAEVERLPHEDRPRDRVAWAWAGPGGGRVELRYQELFRAAEAPPDRRIFASVSGQCVPDFVLIARRAGAPCRWLLLDAKYRCGRKPVHEGLADVHRYRDALRVDGVVADGAYVVVPRLDPAAALYGTEAYLAAHRTGALAIYEGDWSAPLRRWVRETTTPVPV